MDRFLPYLIQEEIYLVKEDQVQTGSGEEYRRSGKEVHVENLTNKTILLIGHENPEMLSPDIRDLLANILRAINLNLEETVLIALPDKESNQDPFFGYQMNECKIIGFMDSVPPGCQAVFDVQKYNLYPTGNSISMLVDPLEEIDRNRSKKVILWKKLKELYNLKSASQKSL